MTSLGKPRRAPAPTRETELGTEKQCATCNTFRPADTEFFYARAYSTGLHYLCRACHLAKTPSKKRTPQPPVTVPDVFSAVQWGSRA